MNEFDKIYLSWRPGQGKRRHIVGVLTKHSDGKFIFGYDREGVEKAKSEGFVPYTEFANITQLYNGNVLDIFAQRLMKAERADIKSFYDFWEVEQAFVNDKFYLLGHTQGLLPTDNFEFLADYESTPGLHFLTDLAGISEKNFPANSVVPGDVLRYELDKDNTYYQYAVKIYKEEREIGYIKKIHSKVFYKTSDKKLKITVKAVDQNGIIKRIFVKVSF